MSLCAVQQAQVEIPIHVSIRLAGGTALLLDHVQGSVYFILQIQLMVQVGSGDVLRGVLKVMRNII